MRAIVAGRPDADAGPGIASVGAFEYASECGGWGSGAANEDVVTVLGIDGNRVVIKPLPAHIVEIGVEIEVIGQIRPGEAAVRAFHELE